MKATPEARQREAWRIALELHKLGIKPVKQDNWIVLRPAPPFDLLMRIIELPEGLVESLLPRVIAGEEYRAASAGTAGVRECPICRDTGHIIVNNRSEVCPRCKGAGGVGGRKS